MRPCENPFHAVFTLFAHTPSSASGVIWGTGLPNVEAFI